MSELTAGWKLVAMVTEGECFSLLGQNPWNVEWVRASEPPITVAHPTDASQPHQMRVYDLRSSPSVRFAAGELSNGVWGFYVPAPVENA